MRRGAAHGSGRAAGVAVAAAMGFLCTAAAPLLAADAPGDPVADLNAQYETVLRVLKKPPVSGIVVTEVLPESPAAAAGLRGGDTITYYYGQKVSKLAELREQVAEAIARRLQEQATENVLLRGWRVVNGGAGGETKTEPISIQLPRLPLGIRAVEVETGVAGPRNPAPNRRGTVKMDWSAVMETLRAGDGTTVLRTQERASTDVTAGAGAETWLGWQKYTLKADGEGGLAGTFDIFRVDPDQAAPATTAKAAATAPAVVEKTSFTFHLRVGDYESTPAFILDSAAATYPGSGGLMVSASATRSGDDLTTEISRQAAGEANQQVERHSYVTPLTGLVQTAVPWVAAAMPHEDGAVLAVHLLSVRDFLPRPGYVVTTRGRQPLPAMEAAAATQTVATRATTKPAATKPATTKSAMTKSAPTTKPLSAESAWRVDLMHCGVLIESYWFSDQRRLLCIESAAMPAVVSRRVDEPEHAMAPAAPGKPDLP